MSDTKTPADVPLVHPENQPEPSTEIGPEAAPPPASKRRLPFETLGVAVAAWAWAAILLRVWDMPMRLPFDTRSDATLISAMVKTIEERGWYLNQPRLGAPFGQQFYDFPHGGESFQLFAMKALVTVTGDWGLAINLYFLLGFGVLAGVTFLVPQALDAAEQEEFACHISWDSAQRNDPNRKRLTPIISIGRRPNWSDSFPYRVR